MKRQLILLLALFLGCFSGYADEYHVAKPGPFENASVGTTEVLLWKYSD